MSFMPYPVLKMPVVLSSLGMSIFISENVVCLCRPLNILANFKNLFLHTGKQCGP